MNTIFSINAVSQTAFKQNLKLKKNVFFVKEIYFKINSNNQINNSINIILNIFDQKQTRIANTEILNITSNRAYFNIESRWH